MTLWVVIRPSRAAASDDGHDISVLGFPKSQPRDAESRRRRWPGAGTLSALHGGMRIRSHFLELVVALTSVFAATACGGEASDANRNLNGSCSETAAPTCLDDLGSGVCSDVARPATCNSGQWSCPAGTLEQSNCVCLGPPPTVGCSCTSTGWSCPNCSNLSPPTCFDDRGNGECSDTVKPATCGGGQWSCPSGTLEQSTCVCLGPPPSVGCSCISTGWSCP